MKVTVQKLAAGRKRLGLNTESQSKISKPNGEALREDGLGRTRRFVTNQKHPARLQDSLMSRRAAEIEKEQRKKRQEGGRTRIV